MNVWLRLCADVLRVAMVLGVVLVFSLVLGGMLGAVYSTPLELPEEEFGDVVLDRGDVDMNPAVIAAGASALSAATQFADSAGLFGSRSGPDRDFWGRYWRDWQLNWRDFGESKRRFDKGVQVRVADAQKAGVHPLFALGYQSPGYNPPFMGTGESGSLGGEATRRFGDASRAFSDLSLRLVQANIAKTEAEAHKANSEAKTAESVANAVQDQHVGFISRQPGAEPVPSISPRRALAADLFSSSGAINWNNPEESIGGMILEAVRDSVRHQWFETEKKRLARAKRIHARDKKYKHGGYWHKGRFYPK